MNRLILISGDLASGKSSLADSLSLLLNVPAFKKDIIKERYCDEIGYTTREENRKLSIMAMDYMINAFKNFAINGQELILEANFREEELNSIKEISDKYQYEVVFFLLRGEMEDLYQRFLDRLPNRHRAHISLHLNESIDKFKEYVLGQRNINYHFIPHIINTSKHNQVETLEIAKSYLFNKN